MTLADILRTKGSEVLTISPDATLDDVVQTLVRHNCGSLIVCAAEPVPAEPVPAEPGTASRRMLGIITERDILKACAARRGPLDQLRVRDCMTAQPVIGAATDQVEKAMGLMTEKRIRHLPILQGDELVGMISIGDLVKAQHDQFAVENHYMKSYIQG